MAFRKARFGTVPERFQVEKGLLFHQSRGGIASGKGQAAWSVLATGIAEAAFSEGTLSRTCNSSHDLILGLICFDDIYSVIYHVYIRIYTVYIALGALAFCHDL